MIQPMDATVLSMSTDFAAAVSKRPLKILHVLGGMDRGGAETWLMHVLRNIDTDRFRMEFLVHTKRRCAYDDEIESLGGRIHYCGEPSKPLTYAKNVVRLLRNSGPYDIVHSHVHHFSGFVLALARAAGAKGTIAHSHNDTRDVERGCSLARSLYLGLGQHLIHRFADRKVTVSDLAGDCLFGPKWKQDPNASRLYCGIDLASFETLPDRNRVRRQFGLTPSDFVVGHVGRFYPQKNHEFILRTHAEVVRANPNVRLLLVGEGPLMPAARATATALGISDAVVFAGSRPNVPELMMGAMDLFIMPSLHEGLPLVALEAQAAGLPGLLSDTITPEVDADCGLVQFLPIDRGPEIWAEQILRHSPAQPPEHRCSLPHLRKSVFSIQNSLSALCNLYTTMCGA